MRTIFRLPAESAKIADCLAERGEFEPPRPLGFMGGIEPEFGALFAPKKSICARENLFALDSALLRLSPVRFVRQGRTPMLDHVEHQIKASGSNRAPV